MARVAVIAGARTPFVRAFGAFSSLGFLELGVEAVKGLFAKVPDAAHAIDELVFGTVLLDPRTPNWARELVFRARLPKSITAHSVSNNCISGLVAVNVIAEGILAGRIRAGVAGGSESMSRPTLTFHPRAENFFLKLSRAKSFVERLKLLPSYRPAFALPVEPSPKEPSTGMTMGQHCELMAKEFQISREHQDLYALRSHQNAARAVKAGVFTEEIVPVQGVNADNIVRGDTTIEKLSKLKPAFDKSSRGTLTPGNSSALTDGASAVLLMEEGETRRRGLTPLGYIQAVEFAAIAPEDGLLMAPALAVPRLLKRVGMTFADIDRFEVHEAFAAQVLCNMQVWEQGWKKYPELSPLGKIPLEKLNVNGGSLALGHPFAATGGRLVLSGLQELQRSGLNTCLISVCAAGAMGCAVLLTRQ